MNYHVAIYVQSHLYHKARQFMGSNWENKTEVYFVRTLKNEFPYSHIRTEPFRQLMGSKKYTCYESLRHALNA